MLSIVIKFFGVMDIAIFDNVAMVTKQCAENKK